MTDTTEPKRIGRPPKGADKKQMRGVRMTPREWATYQALGGPQWFGAALARARLTPEQRARRDAIESETLGQLDIGD